MEIALEPDLLVAVDFINSDVKRLAGYAEQAGEFEIRRSELRAAIDDHHDGGSFVECNPGLPEDLCRNEVFVVGDNAACVDYTEVAPTPLAVAIEAVSGDARFIADDRTARAHQVIEQRGFTHIRAAHDGEQGNLRLLTGGSMP